MAQRMLTARHSSACLTPRQTFSAAPVARLVYNSGKAPSEKKVKKEGQAGPKLRREVYAVELRRGEVNKNWSAPPWILEKETTLSELGEFFL